MNEDQTSETTNKTGYGRPPRATRFQKGRSGNPRGRPRGGRSSIPYDGVLGQMVTIREDGREWRVTAAEAFLLQLTLKGLAGDSAAARASLAAIEEARANRPVEDQTTILRIVFIAMGFGSVLQDLGIAVKTNRQSEKNARWWLNRGWSKPQWPGLEIVTSLHPSNARFGMLPASRCRSGGQIGGLIEGDVRFVGRSGLSGLCLGTVEADIRSGAPVSDRSVGPLRTLRNLGWMRWEAPFLSHSLRPIFYCYENRTEQTLPLRQRQKNKHCHGRPGPTLVTDPRLIHFLNQARAGHEARERIRQNQQGRGKPIIALKADDHQIVAVGKKVMFSKKWNTFVDFLGDYLMDKLTPTWANQEIAKPLAERHIVLQWYDELCRQQRKAFTKPGEPIAMDATGVLICYYGLAYALYLLEHNVELQNRMIARLKDRSNFQGAYYELMIARVLIAAGFELTLEDEVDRSTKHCEFAAVSKDTKQKYWIEAKMRSVAGLLGGNEKNSASEKKVDKPLSKLVTHLHAALQKPADDQRMVFIDINTSMRIDADDESRPPFVDAVNRRLLKYEKQQLEEGKTAYVFVTNMTFHRALSSSPQMICIPGSVGIPDFNRSGHMKLSEIYRRDQKHSDALRVGESMSKLLSFPTTFDGSMPGTTLKGERPTVQIGETYNFEGAGPDGSDLIGEVTDAIVDEKAKEVIVAIWTPDEQAIILKDPMTDGQLNDYRANKEAYFGRIKHVPKQIKTPYELFRFFMEGQKDMTRARLLEQLKMSEEQASGMSNADLLIEYCERQVAGSGFFKVVDGVMTGEPAQQMKAD